MFWFLFLLGNQPNIHPGCIPSTGRNVRTNNSAMQPTAAGVASSISGLSSVSLGGLNLVGNVAQNILMSGGATSTQNAAAQQLIGGAISPSLFVTASHDNSNAHQQIPINHHIHQQSPLIQLQPQVQLQQVSFSLKQFQFKFLIFFNFFFFYL